MTPTDSLPQAQINHKGKHEQKLISGKTECKHGFGLFAHGVRARGARFESHYLGLSVCIFLVGARTFS